MIRDITLVRAKYGERAESTQAPVSAFSPKVNVSPDIFRGIRMRDIVRRMLSAGGISMSDIVRKNIIRRSIRMRDIVRKDIIRQSIRMRDIVRPRSPRDPQKLRQRRQGCRTVSKKWQRMR